MPSGYKYRRHETVIKFLKQESAYDFLGSYKEYKKLYGANSGIKNCDLVGVSNTRIHTWEVKVHGGGNSWGSISYDQAERLLTNHDEMIIVEYDDVKQKVTNIHRFNGKKFVKTYCYFCKNGAINYDYKQSNKRVFSHKVTELLPQARLLFS
jgi:hypothetical protein